MPSFSSGSRRQTAMKTLPCPATPNHGRCTTAQVRGSMASTSRNQGGHRATELRPADPGLSRHAGRSASSRNASTSNSPGERIPGFVHLYAGEEASAVGVCMHLTDRDNIASTHRGHGHCIAKGCDVDGMMKEIFGRRDGLCGGKGGSMHIADLSKGMLGANGIVGGGPPLICGAALTAKVLGTGGIAVAFVGEAAPTRAPRWKATTSPRCGTCRPSSSSRTTATPNSPRRLRPSPAASSLAPPASASPRVEVDGFDFFAVHEAAGGRSSAPARGGGSDPDPCAPRPLLRPFRGRRDDLSRPRRGRAPARRTRLPRRVPPPRHQSRALSIRRCWTRSTRDITADIDRSVRTAKASAQAGRSRPADRRLRLLLRNGTKPMSRKSFRQAIEEALRFRNAPRSASLC